MKIEIWKKELGDWELIGDGPGDLRVFHRCGRFKMVASLPSAGAVYIDFTPREFGRFVDGFDRFLGRPPEPVG